MQKIFPNSIPPIYRGKRGLGGTAKRSKKTPLSHKEKGVSKNEYEYEILELDLGYQHQAKEATERRSAFKLL
jgi:hypothetical protein